ncbi:hypothetical protein ZEAMMB73_Zm00001d049797 [Zea mays]|uniref:Uncharacterized protein n=1 Tax=Zea mays TaxID=4577 RepID=A0A1D6PY77_MAIZE|nr:hypothetical protein ZEAMMB73_Zm00001d049797 [Zea mays]
MDEILSIDADVSEVELGRRAQFFCGDKLTDILYIYFVDVTSRHIYCLLVELNLVAATKKGGRCGGDAGAQPPGMYGIDLGTIVGLELDVDIVAANTTTKKLLAYISTNGRVSGRQS